MVFYHHMEQAEIICRLFRYFPSLENMGITFDAQTNNGIDARNSLHYVIDVLKASRGGN
ncbi:hypothetical protein WN55_03512 [Dufourea novaeangliae]|uniref:Uncharacterized protein n=1 Tax=Dufourea novaeangliae TaxID=178035 RepID=A0A154PJP1_DUFNO|nr:hypothetical protein WN55_03512 [Dufourea novaeangliae]